MHCSRLTSFLLDVEERHFDTTLAFWCVALGLEPAREAGSTYVTLSGPLPAVTLMLQRVESERRGMHLDIETDDVEAEVRRLEALGARRVQPVKTWWVMEDPSGQRFCVVRIQHTGWPEGAKTWG